MTRIRQEEGALSVRSRLLSAQSSLASSAAAADAPREARGENASSSMEDASPLSSPAPSFEDLVSAAVEERLAMERKSLEAQFETEKAALQQEAKAYRSRLAGEVNALAEEVGALAQQLEKDAAAMAAEVGFAALIRVLGTSRADRSLFIAICEQMMEERVGAPLRIRVHPDLLAELPEFEQIDFVADSGLGRGQQLIETPRGDVDAGVNVRLRGICEAFIGALDT
jgi:flagellar biosynthesis/type III secretory pathway protein FliH